MSSAEVPAPASEAADFPARLRDALPYIIYVFDLSSGTTVYQNRSWARELGYSEQQIEAMQGRLIEHVAHPDDRARLPELIGRWATASDRDVLEVEYRMRRADGEWRWFAARDSVFERDASGKVKAIVGTTIDVTERKLLQSRLQQGQKLEAIGRLAGGVAHDFNNILAAIQGYVELSRRDLHSPAELAQDLDDLEKATHQAVSLTKQLLTFARQETERPEIIDVNAHIRDISKLLARLVSGSVRLELALCDGPLRVSLHPAGLTQILHNLVVNARDAMSDGGELRIATALDGAGGGLTLTVTDSGSGMTDEVSSRIFEPFFTTKTPDQGSGLGLSTVYGIVTRANGAISVRSEPGRGTQFEIQLPLVTDAALPR